MILLIAGASHTGKTVFYKNIDRNTEYAII